MQKKILFILTILSSCCLLFSVLQAAESSVGELAQEPAGSPNDSTTTLFPISNYKQDTYEDLNTIYPMDAPNPDNVKSVVDYDPVSGLYVLRTYVGDTEIITPYAMTEQEYYDYSAKQAMNRYWREKDSDGEGSNEDKFSITDMKFNIGAADKLFGPGGVQVKTQGSAELTFGVSHRKIDNPSISERQRKSTTPDFDQNIQLNVNAKVGTRVNFNMNYNTESSFSFDQKTVKLGFKGEEDDIIQNLEAGNVSMQTSNSLISGGTSLFGIKTDLKFGKLKVSAIATQQQSESKKVSSKGGTQTTDFDISIEDYDDNRHFFLAHYFRDTYEKGMAKLPTVSSGVKITRLEAWITNKRGTSDQTRNIVAFTDLGEKKERNLSNSYWYNSDIGDSIPDNETNLLYQRVINVEGVRDVQQTNQVLSAAFSGNGIEGGEDYEKVESARPLSSSEYTYNEYLGTISLRSVLAADEVLAVAYEYTYKGKAYQVGEFSADADVKAPNVLVVKMLKSTAELTDVPMWRLKMKNVYRITTSTLQQEDFLLNIVYRNDSIGTDLQYITEGAKKNQTLLKVMNLDRLDQRQRTSPDGKFDYVDGYTVNSSTGSIIFPVLEPFGSHLRKQIDNDEIADKYVFEELYSMTLVEAQEYSDKNKFRLTGEYKGSGAANQINLNSMNIPRGSVTVTAGGQTLIENSDYTVDYIMGTVTILDQALLESNTSIDVQLENQSLFNMQRKSLFGTHIEYEFSKNFMLGGTVMHLSETPLTTKVSTGSEPISNTIWGLNTSWRGESQWLTNAIDKLPFVNATAPSSFSVNAEFAHLIPGESKAIEGYSYLDDFEATKQNNSLNYNPAHYWKLASTPSTIDNSDLSNDVAYGHGRALISWYSVDPILNQEVKNTPQHLRDNPDERSKHITRNVQYQEIYPNKTIDTQTSSVLRVMNVSYFPTERGPYNLDWDGVGADGKLTNPKDRWGGLMRKIDSYSTNFEERNIEYIEFWMLDPFVEGVDQEHKGGDLFFNLGDVSEDILKDGKKFFENGLNANGDISQNDSTEWGYVPKGQSTVTAFDNSSDARKYQDVGLNGLSSEQERNYRKYKTFLETLRNKITDQTVMDKFETDPAGDNFHYYRGSDYDDQELDILSRYKYYNGTEGNSADISDTSESYATSLTNIPDTEDVNDDYTLNEYEKYWEYRISIRKEDLSVVGQNYITEIAEREVTLPNGNTETVTWYQFKVPVSAGTSRNNIKNHKSIRFMRMYMTDFEEEMTLRFATLDLVRGDWRTYTKNEDLRPADYIPASEGQLDVLAVNIDENASKTPVNYVLPPGISRQTTPGQAQIIPQNEQAMVMRVVDLAKDDARGVYKKVSYDMRQYKRLQMFVHAEEMTGTTLADQNLACFVRLGTDMTTNYYEYEIPLVLTPEGVYLNNSTADRLAVWPEVNMFDFPFEALTTAKTARNKSKQQSGSTTSNITRYTITDPEKQNNNITVMGNPTISNVKYIMIGIRNKSNETRSGEIWVNELRMSEFDNDGGWAAQGNAALALSDIASVNVAGRRETAGFGSIESTVQDRRMDDLYQFNISTSGDIGRFLPEKAKIQIPTYFSYSNEKTTPKYNPLDEDILLKDALDALETNAQRDSLKQMSNTVTTAKSFNITNAKVNIRSKKPQFYDPANISITYAYTQSNAESPDIQKDMVKEQRAAIDYSHSFNSQPVEPFKKVKALDKPAYKIIKDINFYYLPTSISLNTDMSRQFSQIVLRDFNAESSSDEPLDLTFSKDFMWSRRFNISYNLTKAISLSFNAATNATVFEGTYVPELGKEYYEAWRDTVWQSIKGWGTPYSYQQNFTASWNVPINKIPVFSWITANASYNSTYAWNRIEDENMGNVANSSGAWQIGGQFNFEQLYNKSKYLKAVDTRMKQQGNRPKFQSKTYTETVNLKGGEAKTVNHRLGSNRLQITATDKSGRPIRVSQNTKNNSSVEITTGADTDSILLTIASMDPNFRNPAQKAADFSVRTLMLVRRASFTYRESNSMSVPGFTKEPGFLGQTKSSNGLAPGIGFAFGFFDEDNTIQNMRKNDWLIGDQDSIVNPAIFGHSTDFDAKISLEPIVGLKIELNAKQSTQYTKSIQYMQPENEAGTIFPTTFTGNYNTTLIAIKTAFRKTGNSQNNYYSQTYETFKENRRVIKDRLNDQYRGNRYPSTGFILETDYAGEQYNDTVGAYTESSADVLIPAFLAAYTGRDVNKIGTNPFIALLNILPNWRITYDGLSRIPWIKDHFRSVNLSHGYTCRYTIGSYTSYSTWVPMEDGSEFGYVRNNLNKNPVPSTQYDIPSVTLSEQFSPLIGVNVTLKNSMTAKVEFKKQRNLSLNLSSTQLVDGSSDEFVVGFGYTLKDFDIILGLKSGAQSKIKNDLKLNVDVSYKDNKMLLRKLDEDLTQATSGNKVFGIKIMADYVFSSKINLQAFFDHQGTTPLISSSYPVKNTNAGIGIKFMLTR